MQGKDVSDFNKPDIFCFPNKCWNKVWATFANIIVSRQVKSSINEILHQVQKILVQGKYKPDCNKLSGFRFSEICWNKSGLPSEMSAGPVLIFCDTTQSFLFLSLRFTAYAFMCTWWNMVSAPPPKHSTFASAPVNLYWLSLHIFLMSTREFSARITLSTLRELRFYIYNYHRFLTVSLTLKLRLVFIPISISFKYTLTADVVRETKKNI